MIKNSDDVAYCRCRLRTDLLAGCPDGVYVEVKVRSNVDNLSLAITDFDNPGGRSSVTFSPDTGAVLRERKVLETPRAVVGKYIHLLTSSPDMRFEGTIGIFLKGGHLAFFRRWNRFHAGVDLEPWETTGFCSDLGWAKGPRLSLCLAFRDEGQYHVCISKLAREPPMPTTRNAEAYEDRSWSLLFGHDDHPLAI